MKIEECGGDIELTEDLNRNPTNLTSPGFQISGTGRYPRNSQCTWNLRISEDSLLSLRIRIEVIFLDLQNTWNCGLDSIMVNNSFEKIK